MELSRIHNLLLEHYGRQGWWPVTSPGKLHPEYSGGPETGKQKLEVIFGAILTQNTSWKNVEKAISELNKRDLIDADKILEISQEELASLIKSSGYFNQKAKKLKNVAVFLKERPIDELEKLEIAELRKDLLGINGIGPETADSIVLYVFRKPSFVVDAYTKRIFSRIGICERDISYDALQGIFHERLEKDAAMLNEYHALIVEHAKRVCRKVPECKNCIINGLCKKRI